MMSVINQDSKVFQANAIFLQPSWNCSKNCPGCYVHEKANKFLDAQSNTNVWKEIVDQVIVLRDQIQAGQITFALDALPAYDDVINNGTYSNRTRMQLIAENYIETVSYTNRDFECHITTNHINDLLKYEFGVIKNLDLLSISNILSVEQVVRAREEVPGAKINWNTTSGDFVRQVNRQGLDEVKKILRKVDSVYLLLHKAPLGQSGHAISDFFQAVNLIQQFKEPVPETDDVACPVPSLLSKFNLDGCMNDSVQFLKKGFGCSSNISRFQIWPDGRVTGCAYNSHNQYGKFAFNFTDVLENLNDAKQRYEFSGRNAGKACTIPTELKDYSNKKHLQVSV